MAGGDVEHLLHLLARVVHARAALIALEASTTPPPCRCLNIPEQWLHIYAKQLANADLHPLRPLFDPAHPMLANLGRWYSARSLMTLNELKLAGIWNVARSLGIGDVAAAKLWGPLSGSIYVAVLRSLQRGPFTPTDLSLLDLFSPHIVASLASKRAQAAIAEPPTDGLSEALDRVDGYAVLHPPSGQIHLCPRACKLLNGLFGPLKASDRLRLENMLIAAARNFCRWPLDPTARSQRLFPELRVEFTFACVADPALPRPREPREPTKPVEPVQPREARDPMEPTKPVEPVQPVQPDVRGRSPRPEAALTALLLHEQPEAEDRDSTTALNGLAAAGATTPMEELLTRRQRQVARAAAAGKTISEIAAALGIHVETARTHLKKAYRSLGVTNRTELAARLYPRGMP